MSPIDLDSIAICANASILRKFDYSKIKKVFYPKNSKEIIDAINYATKHKLYITVKGGGSGLSGACTGGNKERIFISTHRLKKIYRINPKKGYAWVAAGYTPDEINKELSEYGVSFNVSPSSREVATVGGLLSTDGGGNDTWMYGTMRDNTLAVELITDDAKKVVITHDGVSTDDPTLKQTLEDVNITLNDVAGSHGSLGIISKLKIRIYKKKTFNQTNYGLLKFGSLNELGKTIVSLINKKAILPYSEAISYVMPEMSDKAPSPVLFFKIPKAEMAKLKGLPGEYTELTLSQFERMYEIRRSYPKLNPPQGTQFALFEGYGFTEQHLNNLDSITAQIDQLLSKHHIIPFGKYGHAPSKWYGEDDLPKFGYIQHAREVPLKELSGKEVLDVIIDIVDFCNELDITPKPEHKWWLQSIKRNRMIEIRNALATNYLFNPWIVEAHPFDLSEFV